MEVMDKNNKERTPTCAMGRPNKNTFGIQLDTTGKEQRNMYKFRGGLSSTLNKWDKMIRGTEYILLKHTSLFIVPV